MLKHLQLSTAVLKRENPNNKIVYFLKRTYFVKSLFQWWISFGKQKLQIHKAATEITNYLFSTNSLLTDGVLQ